MRQSLRMAALQEVNIPANHYTVDCLDPIQSVFVCGKGHYKLDIKKEALTTWMED